MRQTIFEYLFYNSSESSTLASSDVNFVHQYVDHDVEYAAVNEAILAEKDPRYIPSWNFQQTRK